MNSNKNEIVLGVLSILSTMLFTGIPIGKNIIEIITITVFLIGLLLIIYFEFIKRNSKITIITSIVYLLILLLLVGIIETKYKDFTLIAIGFIPGLLISSGGLVLTKKNKTKVGLILNIIGLVLSIISLLLVITNGGFIIK